MPDYSDTALYFVYGRILFFLFGLMVFMGWQRLFKDKSFSGDRVLFLSLYDFSYAFYRVFFLFLSLLLIPLCFSFIDLSFLGDYGEYLVYLCTMLLGFLLIKFLILDSEGIGFFFFIGNLFSFDRKYVYLAFQGFFLACFVLFFVSLFNSFIIAVYTYSVEVFEGGGRGIVELFEEFSSGKGYSFSYLERIFSSGSIFAPRALFFIFLVIFFAPFCEEVFFRGTMLPILSKKLGFFRSNVLISFMFALIHFDIYSFMPLFALSLMLGLVYYRLGILYSSVLLHSFWNIQSFLTYLILYL